MGLVDFGQDSSRTFQLALAGLGRATEARGPIQQPLFPFVEWSIVMDGNSSFHSNRGDCARGLLSLNGALGKGKLGARLRERIALVAAEPNGCEYCPAAHTYLAHNVAEIGPNVALNVLTNYITNVARTDLDCPKVSPRSAA